MNTSFDVVVIGGGAAGLSGALMLTRSRRSVLVIDAGEPRNAPAEGVHGFLSRDGMNPFELLELGRAEVRRYGGEVISGRVSFARREDDGFAVATDFGGQFSARRLLVTTGLVDELPAVPGVRERWGRDVVHCPYCHGWEVRDRAIGVLANGSAGGAAHMALLFRQLSSDVTVFLHTASGLSEADAERLRAREIRVVNGIVNSLVVECDELRGIKLQDGRHVPLQALVAVPRFVARSEVLTQLGLQTTPHPQGMGEFIQADAMGQTAVPGVYVAGNVNDLSANVIASAAAGSRAGAAINADLVSEDVDRCWRHQPVPPTTGAIAHAAS